jgi:hypothetical protein
VDIRHHLIPDFYRTATEHDGQSVGGVLPAEWSQTNAVSFMDDGASMWRSLDQRPRGPSW